MSLPQERFPGRMSLGRIGILVSVGKAYYALLSQLERRGIEYVTLVPGQPIPLDVRVLILTDDKSHDDRGRKLVYFGRNADPRQVVEEAAILLRGKTSFKELIIGVDPGKQTGLAALGDGEVVETGLCMEVNDVVKEVCHMTSIFPFERSVVKIGRGPKEYSKRIRSLLASRLSSEVEIQIVEESGTTSDTASLKMLEGLSRNIVSAIRIALRKGRKIDRCD